MRIGINAALLKKENLGVENYTFELLGNLSKIDTKNEYIVFLSSPPESLGLERKDNLIFEVSSLPALGSSARIVWEQAFLPFGTRKHKLNVFHNPDHMLPVFPLSCPSIITVHDLAFLKFPETFFFGKRFYKQNITKLTIKKAKAIISVSENTKRDIVDLFGIPKERIYVIPEGISPDFKQISDKSSLDKVRQKYDLPDRYILNVGALEPRKNIPLLLHAYSRLVLNKGIREPLVIAGSKGWLFDSIFDTVRELKLEEKVKFLGYVPKDDLPFLYNLAHVFVYPSLYEGFGFPPLEAMACGTPVITSNTSSFPETVGDSGIMVDPHDSQGFADAIFRVISNDSLRKDLISRGFERAQRFSWEDCARKTLTVYESVFKG